MADRGAATGRAARVEAARAGAAAAGGRGAEPGEGAAGGPGRVRGVAGTACRWTRSRAGGSRAGHRLPAFPDQGGAVRGGGHGAGPGPGGGRARPGGCRRSGRRVLRLPGPDRRGVARPSATCPTPSRSGLAARRDLNAALDVLLRRAQQAGAVRGDVRTPDLIVLLKGLFASLADVSDPARRDLVFAILAERAAAAALSLGPRDPAGAPCGPGVLRAPAAGAPPRPPGEVSSPFAVFARHGGGCLTWSMAHRTSTGTK